MINIDGVGVASHSLIEEARDELAMFLKEQCKATLTVDMLDKDKRELDLEF